MKKLLAILLALIMVLGMLAGCAAEEAAADPQEEQEEEAAPDEAEEPAEEEDDTILIGNSFCYLTSQFMVIQNEGAQAAADENGIEIVHVSADADASKQLADIEDMIAMGCDGIMIQALDSKGILTAIEKCADAGIPVVVYDTLLSEGDEENIIAAIGTDNYSTGVYAAEALYEASGGEAKIGIVTKVVDETIRLRIQGFEDTIAKYPGMEVVVSQDVVSYTPEQALPCVENFLQSNPELTAIFMGNDPTATAAINACQAAGREDIMVLGIDGAQEAMEHIIDGTQLGTAMQYPYLNGYYSVEFLLEYLNGTPAEEIELDGVKINDRKQYLIESSWCGTAEEAQEHINEMYPDSDYYQAP